MDGHVYTILFEIFINTLVYKRGNILYSLNISASISMKIGVYTVPTYLAIIAYTLSIYGSILSHSSQTHSAYRKLSDLYCV